MERRYLATKEVEEIYGIKRQTLAVWRMHGKGPGYVKLDGKVLYSVNEIERWLASNYIRTIDSPQRPPQSS